MAENLNQDGRKDLTVSQIDRQNILNNPFALKELEQALSALNDDKDAGVGSGYVRVPVYNLSIAHTLPSGQKTRMRNERVLNLKLKTKYTRRKKKTTKPKKIY